jgi:hypothetical protein
MSAEDQPLPARESTAVTLARLEGKLDTAIALLKQETDEHKATLDDHEQRLRTAEQRLSDQEHKPTISPRQFWSGAGSIAVAVGAIWPILFQVLHH